MEHPTGIEPWGNYYMRGGGRNIRDEGLGSLSELSDAIMLELLGCGVLRAKDLGLLALTSKALYCFANLEDLWKGMVIEELGGGFTWCGTWQRTYLVSSGLLHGPAGGAGANGAGADSASETASEGEDDDEPRDEEEGGTQESGSVEEGSSEEGDEEDVEDEEEEDEEEVKGRGKQCTGRQCGGAAAKMELEATELEAGPAADVRVSKRRRTEGVSASKPAAASGTAADGCNGKAASDLAAAGARVAEAAADAAAEAAGPGPSSSAAAAAAETQLKQGGCGGGGRRRLMHRLRGCGPQRYLRVQGFYSDLLYQPWFCATLDLPYEWLETDNIDRRSGLTPEQFRREYEIPNRPVILQDVMSSWTAMRKWNREYLAEVFGDREVIVGNMPMPFTTYLSYCSSNRDEMPLYLFDKHFAVVAPSLESDYCAPPQFGEDLFGLLGPEGRPDYRWLILGPGRSGSSFHVDPNATSAWNALLWGAKKWVMYPPGAVPPGVHPSPDGADVATPLSLTEWFVNFYAATREGKVRPIEFIARPGDLLFVPRGWWHCALNLQESCALTQNFVSEVGLPAVLSFLKSRSPELVSGCAHENRCDLYDRFVAALRQHRPGVLAAVEARQQEARAKAREAGRLAALFRAPEETHGNGTCHGHSKTCNGNGNGLVNGYAANCVAPDGGKSCGGDHSSSAAASCGGGGVGFSFGFSSRSGAAPTCSSSLDGGTAAGGFKFGFGL